MQLIAFRERGPINSRGMKNILSFSCIPDLRPASSVPVVALMVALIGTLTCLLLVAINYRKTRKVLAKVRCDETIITRDIQTGASYLSQGFEDNVLGSSHG